jgi:hypothetical protein
MGLGRVCVGWPIRRTIVQAPPWNHQEPLCGPPFPHVTTARETRGAAQARQYLARAGCPRRAARRPVAPAPHLAGVEAAVGPDQRADAAVVAVGLGSARAGREGEGELRLS